MPVPAPRTYFASVWSIWGEVRIAWRLSWRLVWVLGRFLGEVGVRGMRIVYGDEWSIVPEIADGRAMQIWLVGDLLENV